MEHKYFAQVIDGIVTQVRKTTTEYMSENPELYPGTWFEVNKIEAFPARGWSWSISTGFIAPIDVEE